MKERRAEVGGHLGLFEVEVPFSVLSAISAVRSGT
jgi:hypothetical protein